MSAPGDGADVQPVDPQVLYSIRRFRQPTWRAVVQAGLFLTIAGLGLSMALGQPSRPELGWPMAVFGLVFAATVPMLTTFGGRRSVELHDEGFVVRTLLSRRRHRWADVSDFALATLLPGRGMRQSYVVYDAAGDRGLLVRLNRFLTGRGRSLPVGIEPDGFPGNSVTVAVAMNAWRERALDSATRNSA